MLIGQRVPISTAAVLVEGVLHLAALAFAVSLASLLAGYRYRVLAALGLATSVLVFLLALVAAILG